MLVANKLVDHVVIGVEGTKGLETQIPAHFDANTVRSAVEQVHATNFAGKANEFFTTTIQKDSGFIFITFVGLEGREGAASQFVDLGEQVAAYLMHTKPQRVSFHFVDKISTNLSSKTQLENFMFGFARRVYADGKALNGEPAMMMPKELHFLNASGSCIKHLNENIVPCIEGMFLSFQLADGAPNKITPKSIASICERELKPLGLNVQTLSHTDLEKEGLGLITAVGKGSKNRERVVVIEWGTKDTKKPPITFVGKGVTFDSGGLSLKKRQAMYFMKLDMIGAAVAIGLMKAVALQNIQIPIVAVLACAENAVSSTAYRPADVLTSYSGKTVEVMSTDAEGRLVLGDALCYAAKKLKPSCLLSLATLTGAAQVLTGVCATPFFTNNDDLCKDLEEASAETGERLWRFPFAPEGDIKADFADIKNMGRTTGAFTSAGMPSGSGAGATFLKHFVPESIPWAHLDILGTAFKPRLGQYSVEAYNYSGVMIRTLIAYIRKCAQKEK